jgi:hypothetical protein
MNGDEEINTFQQDQFQAREITPITAISRNKKIFFLLIGTTLLLIIIAIILIITKQKSSHSSIKETITPTGINKTTTTPTEIQPTIDKITQQKIIKDETQQQLTSLVSVPYTISKLKQYDETWVLLQITNPETDPANIVVKKENGSWKIIQGPGTFFNVDVLKQLGAPEELLNNVNTTTY